VACRTRREGSRLRRANIPRREAKGTIRTGRMEATHMVATGVIARLRPAARTAAVTQRLLRTATGPMADAATRRHQRVVMAGSEARGIRHRPAGASEGGGSP